MKPSNVKAEIKRIEEHMVIENVLVRTHLEHLDKEIFAERVAEQQAIIDEAVAVIRTIRQRRRDAVNEIGKIEQYQRYEKRRLVVLNNYENIERLKKMAEELKTMSEEAHDGEEHSDT